MKSQKRPPKASGGSGKPAPLTRESGPGIWRLFPLLMVVVGVVVGILWEPSADAGGAAGQTDSSTAKDGEAVAELWPVITMRLHRDRQVASTTEVAVDYCCFSVRIVVLRCFSAFLNTITRSGHARGCCLDFSEHACVRKFKDSSININIINITTE